MLFNSAIFLLGFLPLACLGYQVAAYLGRRATIGWLALASILFYSWWNWRFVPILLGSILLNFAIAHLIAGSKTPGRRKFWMVTGIALNLAGLVYFKYLFPLLNFMHSIGVGQSAWVDVALPLGISFFTFTQIAYLVDLSQGQASPQSLVEYALFVSFFPHLIAGPILHHKEMMPQFLEKRDPKMQMDDMLLGISWFTLGLAKKCIFADQFGAVADAAFRSPAVLGLPGAWCGIILYSLQLYFDFSGYSDMAIGLARMFSIKFPMNFNSPFKAANIIDFWQRWHMTLTRYLTLYLYNPISLSISRRRLRAGKKVSQKAARTVPGFISLLATPTIITMFLAGVWHGAGLQYLIYGLLHGAYISINHAWRLFRGPETNRPSHMFTRAVSVLGTYVAVLVAFIFFRSAGTMNALRFLGAKLGKQAPAGTSHISSPMHWTMAVAGLGIVWFMPNTQQILGQDTEHEATQSWIRILWQPNLRWSVALGVLFFIALLFSKDSATFLYFQF